MSTGEFRASERADTGALHQELLQVEAAEVVWPEAAGAPPAWCPEGVLLTAQPRTPFAEPEARSLLRKRFRLASLDGLGLGEAPLAMRAAGGLLAYLDATQSDTELTTERPGPDPRPRMPLELPRHWHPADHLVLDAQTRRNLELSRTQVGGCQEGSLLWALDRTSTAMGGRCLRRWIETPLVDLSAILARQHGVSELVEQRPLRLALRRLLRPMGDLERLAGRAGAGTAWARDLVALADGLERLPRQAALLRDCASEPLAALRRPWPELAVRLRHDWWPNSMRSHR